jgi:hypothetical protein
MNPGTRVTTPLGPGVVKSKRMAPPDFSSEQAYSVRLDSRVEDSRYAGTVFAAEDIRPEHTKDADCTVGANGCCVECGVSHTATCDCGGRGFHADGCPKQESQ